LSRGSRKSSEQVNDVLTRLFFWKYNPSVNVTSVASSERSAVLVWSEARRLVLSPK